MAEEATVEIFTMTGRSSAIADLRRVSDSVGYEGLLTGNVDRYFLIEADVLRGWELSCKSGGFNWNIGAESYLGALNN